MAFLQSDQQNATRLMAAAALNMHQRAKRPPHRAGYFPTLIRRWREAWQRWRMARGMRMWRIATEHARQRRTLERLTDRELRDIGITRYEVDFLLRRSRWP